MKLPIFKKWKPDPKTKAPPKRGPRHVDHCVAAYITISLRSFEARKAIFLLALILMASPVAGLRPMRAGRFLTCRMPRPEMRLGRRNALR